MPAADYSLNTEYIFYRLYNLFFGDGANLGFLSQFSGLWFWIRFISIPLSIVLAAFIVVLIRKIIALRHSERIEYKYILEDIHREAPKVNPAWAKVLEHMASANPNEWKLAIIEADNLLDELVKTMGYQGESLGERMKNIEPSDFATLQDAWDAHKLRNRIAHESGYAPPEHEARNAVAAYRRVFEEFQII